MKKINEKDLWKFGDTVSASQLKQIKEPEQFEEFGLVEKNGVMVAIPADKLPKSKRSKKKTAPKKKVARRAPAKAKTPKFVPQWKEIREQINQGASLKSIAEAFGVRYYDVYRVKVHGMDL